MQDTKELINKLYNGIVEFEYKKKDGSIRKTKGTLKQELLPKKENEEIKFDIAVINTFLEIKHITLDEYMNSNNIELIKEENGEYIFMLKKKKKEKRENIITYYDLESDSFKSFIKENFVKIIQ